MGSKQANTEIIKLNLLYTGLLMQDRTFRLGFIPNTIAHFLKKSRAIKKAWYILFGMDFKYRNECTYPLYANP